MVTRCASYVRGRMLRATRLDACGNPAYGEDGVVTSKGFVSVAYTLNQDDGTEINVPNAAGERCIYEPAIPRFLSYTVEITFCNVDPDLYALLTGQRVLTNAIGDVVGFTVDSAVSSADTKFALEVWAGSSGGTLCTPSVTGGTFGYVLLPFVQGGVVGDFTIENAEVTFTITGAVTKDGNAWGTGPYLVVLDGSGNPTVLPEALETTDHLVLLMTGYAPPEAECGFRPLLNPSATGLTDVTATPTALSVQFSDLPDTAQPWWIDFGDGEWDASMTGANITHVYDAAGTYTFTAHRGTSTFTDTVTVAP